MSGKLTALIVGIGASLAFVLGPLQGCGGSGQSGSGQSGSGQSGSGWNCVEKDAFCTCAKGSGSGKASCTAAYPCCYSFVVSGVPACNCQNETAATCTTLITGTSGLAVSRCPPP
jgi:hypothetical protein